MAIPRVIHYCWFGNNSLPDKVVNCINSWKKQCPDFEIKRWDEANYDIKKIRFINEAYKEKKWAFVSDYARLDIVYENGGIYLDTDVELIKPIDPLLENEAFLAIDKEGYLVNTGLGFGAVEKNVVIKLLKTAYEDISFYKDDGNINYKACTFYATEILEKFGFNRKDETQLIMNAKILNSEYFCPMDFTTGKMNITCNTFGIHWYEASWFSAEDKQIRKVEMKLNRIFPSYIAKIMGKTYRNAYRIIEYKRKGILKEKIYKKVRMK